MLHASETWETATACGVMSQRVMICLIFKVKNKVSSDHSGNAWHCMTQHDDVALQHREQHRLDGPNMLSTEETAGQRKCVRKW